MSDARIRKLERAARAGDHDADARLQAVQRRRGLKVVSQLRDPRRDPRPGDAVRSHKGIVREVLPDNAPVMVMAGRACSPDDAWGTRVHLALEHGPPPARELTVAGHKGDHAFAWTSEGREVHWRRGPNESRGHKSGCCLLKSWRAWAKGGTVLTVSAESRKSEA